jgi:hypothetical protein
MRGFRQLPDNTRLLRKHLIYSPGPTVDVQSLDREQTMKTRLQVLPAVVLGLAVAAMAQNPAPPQPSQTPVQQTPQAQPVRPRGRSAGGEIGSGAGDVGKGAGKGAGDLAGGAGKGAADIVTLHPVNGAEALGKGVGSAGKNVGVGAAKGTGKTAKGIGKFLKHPY